MKYIVILGDGMADKPVAILNNKTPLELAKKPCIDYLAAHGKCGMVQTIPKGMKPGSDVANLSVMGYAPNQYYSGRSPLEALSMGIEMSSTDVAFRCNLVTLSTAEKMYANRTMIDYSAGEISSEDAEELIYALQQELGDDLYAFYSGVSYRHCLIEHGGEVDESLTPPHDITGKPIFEYLPTDPKLLGLMKRSFEILSKHPINIKRVEQRKNPANSIWLWGAGQKPSLPSFKSQYGINGAIISAVDLLKGIGIAADMKVIDVEGANGRLDTNYRGKAEACLQALNNGCDYVYLHVEAPDECSHQGAVQDKVKAIQYIDSEIVGYLLEKLAGQEFSMLICPDHATPLELKTHTSDPVPYIIYNSFNEIRGTDKYTEKTCAAAGNFFGSGVALSDEFLADACAGMSEEAIAATLAEINQSNNKSKKDKKHDNSAQGKAFDDTDGYNLSNKLQDGDTNDINAYNLGDKLHGKDFDNINGHNLDKDLQNHQYNDVDDDDPDEAAKEAMDAFNKYKNPYGNAASAKDQSSQKDSSANRTFVFSDIDEPEDVVINKYAPIPELDDQYNIKAEDLAKISIKDKDSASSRNFVFSDVDEPEDVVIDKFTPAPDDDDRTVNSAINKFMLPAIEAQEDTVSNQEFILPDIDDVKIINDEESNFLPKHTTKVAKIEKPKKEKAEKVKEEKPKKEKGEKAQITDKQKKKKKIITIAIIALVLAIIIVVSIVTPIMIMNKDKIFVKKASDFNNVNKGNYYVLEKDLIINEDLTLSNPFSIDLNKHNLVINGTLTFNHNQNDKTLNFGTKKGIEYQSGGSITATNLVFDCAGTITSDAVISANNLTIKRAPSTFKNTVSISKKLDIQGGKHRFETAVGFSEDGIVDVVSTDTNNRADVYIKADGKADFTLKNSNIELSEETNPISVTLDELSNAKIYGKVAGDVLGGDTVIMAETSSANLVGGMKTLWVGRDNYKINKITVPVANIKYIVKLETPIDLSISRTEAGRIITTITKVNHAARYAVYVDNSETPIYIENNSSTGAVVTCDITEQVTSVGTHTIKVQALGAADIDTELVVPSAFIKATYVHEVKLDTPSGLAITKSEEKVYLSFIEVLFADEYLIVINGKQIIHRDLKNLKIDITEHVANVGAYSIRVQARNSNNPALKPSEVTMTGHETYKPHNGAITLTQADEDGKSIFSWNKLDSATRHTITITSLDGSVKTIKIHTTSHTFITGELKTGDTISVKADAIGYYQDSASSNVITIA